MDALINLNNVESISINKEWLDTDWKYIPPMKTIFGKKEGCYANTEYQLLYKNVSENDLSYFAQRCKFVKDHKVYGKASVTIKFNSSKSSITKYFDTNELAYSFFNSIKEQIEKTELRDKIFIFKY